MSRGRKNGFSILELEQLLEEKKSSIAKLFRQRSELEKKLIAIDREIEALGGSADHKTAGGRARNGVSLVEAMENLLKGKPPMKVGDILDGVIAGGYRSTSDNFRGIVNQTLIKEKRFQQINRGTYALK